MSRRKTARLLAGMAVSLILLAVDPPGAGAAPPVDSGASSAPTTGAPGVATAPEPTPPPTPPMSAVQARAWIVVDADTGSVIGASNDHLPMRPASVIKIATALTAMLDLPAGAQVPVGLDAAGEEAAKINMQVGQVWNLQDALSSLLIVSANDAAVAIADRVSGSRDAFSNEMTRVVTALGVRDNPVLEDPAGLDDSFAWAGGDQISAWDLALIARAAMTVPQFRQIVSTITYNFVGPDGTPHVLHNHNRLLRMDPTVIGVKPGYTSQAGETLVAEATRGGRSILAVELGANAVSVYPGAEALLGLGFATPVSAEPRADHLPPVALAKVFAAPDVHGSVAAGGVGAGGAGAGGARAGGGGRRVLRATSVKSAGLRSAAAATQPAFSGRDEALAGLVLVGIVVQGRRAVVRRRRRARRVARRSLGHRR